MLTPQIMSSKVFLSGHNRTKLGIATSVGNAAESISQRVIKVKGRDLDSQK